MPRRKLLPIRADDESIQQFKEYESRAGFSTHGETLKDLLKRSDSEIFHEYAECEDFGEYPPDSKHFVQCFKYGKGKRPRKREDCQACGHRRTIRVLMMSKEKLEEKLGNLNADFVNRTKSLEDLKTEITEKKKELTKIESISDMPEQLKQAHKDIENLKKELEQAYKEIEDERVVFANAPISTVEAVKRVCEERPQQKPSESATENHPQVIQQKVEKEPTKTTITTTIFNPLENQLENQLENLEILCSLNDRYVPIADQCKRKCENAMSCSYFLDLIENKIPRGAKTRPSVLIGQ